MINFKYPIEYQTETKKINNTVKIDLELVKTTDESLESIYSKYMKPTTSLGNKCLEEMSNYYTTNTEYLKNTQEIVSNIHNIEFDKEIIEKTYNGWKKLKSEEYFVEKYQYIGWDKLKWLNYSVPFLHLLSIYNIFSPIINLLSPLVVFIVPFVLLKVMRTQITWVMYKKILLLQLKNHAIGQLFTSFNSVSTNKKLYILFCAGMYVYNLYQNVLSCMKYYRNSFFILENMDNLRKYLRYTIDSMENLKNNSKKMEKYNNFSKDLTQQKEKLEYFLKEIENIPTKTLSLSNFGKLGKTMKCFFKIYDCVDLNSIMEYSFKFNGYMDCLRGINSNIKNKTINKVTYKKKYCKMKKIFHPSIENPIKNDIDLSNNKIITGPNASGKTTLLKTVLINIILSQQYGFAYCKNATIDPYDYIHCYLNIPDTSGRDSLFQAEARRCKEILDKIEEFNDSRHICIFDELYSGTNPYEAVSSAYGFLKYIKKYKKTDFLLTTHFIRLCNLLKDDVENCRMKSEINNYKPKYYYTLEKEISKIKGGISVLKEIDYPEEILNYATSILEKIE